MKSITLILALLVVSHSIIHGQNHYVEFLDEQKTTSRGSSYIGMDENGYVYSSSFRSFYAVFTNVIHSYIKVYDSKLGNIVVEKRIDMIRDISKMGYTIVQFMIHDQKPVLLLKKRAQEGDQDYYFIDLNERLKIISEPYKVAYNSECKSFFKTSSVDLYFAEDEETRLRLTISDRSCKADEVVSLYGILRDGNNELIHEFPLILELAQLNQLNTTIYDENKYYLKVLSLERTKEKGKLFKQTERNHILIALNSEGQVKEIDLDILGPGVEIGAFRLLKSNGQLLFSGQVIDRESKKFLGVFTGKVNPETDEISDINTQYFENDFVERFWTDKQSKKASKRRAKGKDDGEGFTGSYKLIDYIATDDGGVVNFYQRYWVKVVTTTRTDANGLTYTTTDYYYNYKDLIPVKTNKDGAIEWVELIPVSQVTVNYDPGTSFLATQKGEDVYVFYNSSNEQDEMLEMGTRSEKRKRLKDKVQRNATIAKIDNNGAITYETVIDMGEERKVYFDPGSMGVDETNNRIIMINNTRRKKSRLVVVSY